MDFSSIKCAAVTTVLATVSVTRVNSLAVSKEDRIRPVAAKQWSQRRLLAQWR